MAKTFLRWAGSKRQLLRRLVRHWPGGNTRYVEPFAGSASLFFELEPHSALLADINGELISTYRIVRERPRAVYDSLIRWTNERTQYYRIRSLQPSSLDDVEQAARFIYLNRFCFNGLYRTNGRGGFNVPYGGEKGGSLPSEAMLESAAALLSRADLLSGDFETILEDVRTGEFVYLDPPYSMNSRRAFTEYSSSPFGEKDLIRLRNTINRLHAIGATFLLSYADCNEGRVLSEGFSRSVVTTKRSIAGLSDNRRSERELIVTNATH